MPLDVPAELPGAGPWLLMDTCGRLASLALFRDEQLLSAITLKERSASTLLLPAVREMLVTAGLRLTDLTAVGVVSGPGSFTGVRLGLAFAKGLSEASGVRLAAVSRLAVMVDAAGFAKGWALLEAGRDQVYAREFGGAQAARERLVNISELIGLLEGSEAVVESPELAARLTGCGCLVQLRELTAADALPAVRRCLAAGGSDPTTLDANYVRDEGTIYSRPGQASKTGAPIALAGSAKASISCSPTAPRSSAKRPIER